MEMEKTLNEERGIGEDIKATKVLELNPNHELFTIFSKVEEDEELVKEYASVLYDEALLLEGYEVSNKQEFEKIMFNIPISCCRYFYKTEFIKNNNISFPEGIKFEDNYFVRKSSLFAQMYGVEREILYFRRVHSDSTTQNTPKFFMDYMKVLQMIENLYVSNNVDKNIIKKTLCDYFGHFYSFIYLQIN